MRGVYNIDVNCAYCNDMNDRVLYEPLEDNFIYLCRKCGKPNFITFIGKSKRIEEVTKEDLLDDILMEIIFEIDSKYLDSICESAMSRVDRLIASCCLEK